MKTLLFGLGGHSRSTHLNQLCTLVFWGWLSSAGLTSPGVSLPQLAKHGFPFFPSFFLHPLFLFLWCFLFPLRHIPHQCSLRRQPAGVMRTWFYNDVIAFRNRTRKAMMTNLLLLRVVAAAARRPHLATVAARRAHLAVAAVQIRW